MEEMKTQPEGLKTDPYEKLVEQASAKFEQFSPLTDKLVCEAVDQEEISNGGIIMPDVEDQKTIKGRVLYTGKGFWAGVGLFIKTELKPGDIILYQRFAAQTFEYEGKDYQIVMERDVLTKINKEQQIDE